MSKTKLFLTIAGALCAVGLVLSAVSFSCMGFDVEKISASPHLEEKSYTVSAEEITEINIHSEDLKIRLAPTSGSEIKVHYSEGERYSCEISAENGMLSVDFKSRARWFDTFRYGIFKDFDFVDRQILVEVPADYSGAVSLRNENASIRVNDVSLKNLECQTSNSAIEIENSTAEKVSSITSNGSVRLTGVTSAGKLIAKNSNGAIRLTGVQAADATVNTSNGSVSLEDTEIATLNTSNSNGKISLRNVDASESLSAVTSNGSIQVDRLSGTDLSLRTSNGKVSGTIAGKESDYGIIANTTNGSNNLEGRIAKSDKTLTIANSNGGIHITFTEK